MSKPIIVPFNENTKHIYETYVRIAREIVERNQREREGREAGTV